MDTQPPESQTSDSQAARAGWPPSWAQAFFSWAERAASLTQVVAPLVVCALIVVGFLRFEWLELLWEAYWPVLGGLLLWLGLSSAFHLWLEGRRARARAAAWTRAPLHALAASASGWSYLAAAGDSLLVEDSKGSAREAGALSDLSRIEVLPHARPGLLGWRRAWPSQTLRLVWLEPPTESTEGDSALPPCELAAPTGEVSSVASNPPPELAEGAAEGEAGAGSAAEPAEGAAEPEPPPEDVRHEETFEVATWSAGAFLRWAALAGIEVRDPHRAYPDVAAARASRGVELFWPPPRADALRYFAGFAVTILGVCAIPAGLMLIGEAKRAPGLVDFGDHVIWMAKPVGEVALMLTLGAVGLTLLQVSFLRVKILRAARRFSLPPGERLLALCYARTRHAWPPLPEPVEEEEVEEAEGDSSTPSSEDVESDQAEAGEGPKPGEGAQDEEPTEPEDEGLPQGPVAAGATWGEFLAITDQRILQLLFGEGRNHVLEVCKREDVLALAQLAPERHPLLTLLRHLRSDGRGVRLWTADGRELQITSEVLFHASLLEWFEAAGHRLEDWGYLPLELEGWIRSPSDPRRAELEAPPDPELEAGESPEGVALAESGDAGGAGGPPKDPSGDSSQFGATLET